MEQIKNNLNHLKVKKNNFKEKDICLEISKKLGYSNLYSKQLIDDLLEVINFNIKNDNIFLKNIGSFKLLKKKERIGRNPKTMTMHVIKSRRTISFKTSKKLSKTINY